MCLGNTNNFQELFYNTQILTNYMCVAADLKTNNIIVTMLCVHLFDVYDTILTAYILIDKSKVLLVYAQNMTSS